KHSGNAPEYLGVPTRAHRLLKGTILGAAHSAVASGNNPFAELYGRWIEQGLSSKLARRNVARAQSATLWGLWKNGSAYRPDWVGVARGARLATEGSRWGRVRTPCGPEFLNSAWTRYGGVPLV